MGPIIKGQLSVMRCKYSLPQSASLYSWAANVTPHSSIGFLTEKNVGVENLSINHFQGLNLVMSMVDKGLVTLTFPVPKNPGIFVVTGVLREHNMDIFKEMSSCFHVFFC